MQASSTALVVLLCTLALCGQVLSEPYGVESCCFTYTSRHVQRRFAHSYFETHSQCSRPAIIFQTKRGQLVCANPREAWVQQLTKYLDQKTH
ncbi:C-C motif chemokine 3-like 1 [Suncus etruscus]|uniref:C-C motif chemokine 3-like 1 n=1 Tax=Suncus etruscus TaxID=109475 RepID=UPI00210F8AA4|nr:C-C motif chemokine 3-like 1 [Suncus etruscus]